MRTVARLHRENLRWFGVIQDSYAVHACDVPRLRQVLREEFGDVQGATSSEVLGGTEGPAHSAIAGVSATCGGAQRARNDGAVVGRPGHRERSRRWIYVLVKRSRRAAHPFALGEPPIASRTRARQACDRNAAILGRRAPSWLDGAGSRRSGARHGPTSTLSAISRTDPQYWRTRIWTSRWTGVPAPTRFTFERRRELAGVGAEPAPATNRAASRVAHRSFARERCAAHNASRLPHRGTRPHFYGSSR